MKTFPLYNQRTGESMGNHPARNYRTDGTPVRPANAAAEDAPPCGLNECAVIDFNTLKWTIQPDYRGHKFWRKSNGEVFSPLAPGWEPNPDYTRKKFPGEAHYFDEDADDWVPRGPQK